MRNSVRTVRWQPNLAETDVRVARIAVLTRTQWLDWNRKHVAAVDGKDAEAEELEALRLCYHLTRRLKARGISLAEPVALERSMVLALSARDVDTVPIQDPAAQAKAEGDEKKKEEKAKLRAVEREPPSRGLVLAALGGQELQQLRKLSFRCQSLKLLNEKGLKEAEMKLGAPNAPEKGLMVDAKGLEEAAVEPGAPSAPEEGLVID